MTTHQHLIIGGGMTAPAAVDGIREVGATGSIGLIGAEVDAPYDRPPLSRAPWNVWDQVAAARQLIADPGPFTATDLKSRLPTSSPEKQA